MSNPRRTAAHYTFNDRMREALADPPVDKAAAVSKLPLLQKAKTHSDKGEYREKALILHALMAGHPEEWAIDEDTGADIVGVTHQPTGFRYHLPRKHVTPGVKSLAPVEQDKPASAAGFTVPAAIGNTVDNTDMEKPAPAAEFTGPAAIERALGKLDMDKLEADHRDIIRRKVTTKRPRAVAILNTLQGLRRNGLTPSDLMLKAVPVIPPVFRPFRVVGSTFVPGDANELYQDLMRYRQGYHDSVKEFGHEGSGDARLALYDSTKALFGHADSPNPKLVKRGVSGFLQQIVGANPKTGWVNSKMIAKPVDTVSRSVATINPDLTIDEIGIPETLAWKMYSPFIQRYMVRHMGVSPAQAVKNLKEQNKNAQHALERVMAERPVVYSRAPSWHKFNVISGRPRMVSGDSIQVNPFITTGQNLDFDGDTLNVHVPVGRDAVQEAYETLMPSKMVWSPRKFDTVVPQTKHEQVLGLRNAQLRPAATKHVFASEDEALKAIEQGKVRLSDEIDIGPGLQ